MTLAIIGLLALGSFLLWLAGRGRERSGVPKGRLVYTDTGGWRRPARPLFSDRYQLTGKPDYLVEEDGALVPVEVKSGRAPVQPYDSHVLQLAAYCLLVEACYGQRPKRGIIKYADRIFEVDYTPALEETLLATMDRMRDDLAAGGAVRSHDEPRRCQACGHRQQCDQRLA